MSTPPPARLVARAALVLGAIAALATALLAGMHAATEVRVAAERERVERAALSALLPDGYDNDPLHDTIDVVAPDALGTDAPVRVHRARRGGQPLGLVVPVVAPDGYAGDIAMLVGIDASGRVIGVRVTHHQETPGLGDPIEASKSRWSESFVGRALGDPPPARWTVRKDGGDFDQFAGATISPRAVVVAVRRALEYVEANRAQLHESATR